METEEVPKPVLHGNGSGYKNLEEQYSKAADALVIALELLPVPHGRDYYPLGDEAYPKVRAKFKEQLAAIRAVHEEISETYNHIYSTHMDSKR